MNYQTDIYQALTSCVDSEEQRTKIKNQYPDKILIDYDNKKYMEFSETVAKQWVLELLVNIDNKDINKIKEKKEYILELKNNFQSQFETNLENNSRYEIEIEIYSYFLYFSGILFLIKEESKELEDVKKFFEIQIQKINDSTLKFFLNFLKVYVDIINPKVKDILVYDDFEECLTQSESHDNIIFKVIEIEYNMMLEFIKSIKDKDKIDTRKTKITENIFPKVERKDIGKDGLSVIESLMLSGLARLYFIAGKNKEHIKKIEESLKMFPSNSFALLQKAYLLADKKYFDKENDTYRNLPESEKKFNKVIKLINEDNQFRNIDSFNYRIKFEAMMGLAYIDYIKGLGKEADKKYQQAEEILEEIKTDNSNKKYLQSILLVNRGRNKLDNLIYKIKRNNANNKDNNGLIKNGKEDEFNQTIDIYNKAERELKDELAKIAIKAYNNLGIYYLNEGLYDEAEHQFKQALHIDNESPHIKYNLGVLYYIKGENQRALKLIRNAQNLDPTFKEAKQALKKLDAEKRRSLGVEWFKWWFKNESPQEEKGSKNRITYIKKVVIFLLIALITMSIAKLAFDLYLDDIYNIAISGPSTKSTSSTNSTSNKIEDIDENAFLVIFAISITIMMLPFINRLKIGDVEIEVESAGSTPLGPASVSTGLSSDSHEEQSIRLGFFYPPFWVYNIK